MDVQKLLKFVLLKLMRSCYWGGTMDDSFVSNGASKQDKRQIKCYLKF